MVNVGSTIQLGYCRVVFILCHTVFSSFNALQLGYVKIIHYYSMNNLFPSLGSQLNGARTSNTYNVGEKEQWCLSTLGYLKAFSRQYASEVNILLMVLSFVFHYLCSLHLPST